MGLLGRVNGEMDGQSSIQYIGTGKSRTILSVAYLGVPKAIRRREAERQKPSIPQCDTSHDHPLYLLPLSTPHKNKSWVKFSSGNWCKPFVAESPGALGPAHYTSFLTQPPWSLFCSGIAGVPDDTHCRKRCLWCPQTRTPVRPVWLVKEVLFNSNNVNMQLDKLDIY